MIFKIIKFIIIILKEGYMIVRILLLFVSFIVLINLCIITACYLTGENLYQKYGKQMLIVFGSFVFAVAVIYTLIALFALE